ncbi:lysylphosphatidylglycerol synthetase family protein [Ilumatobacter nonamiensis]|uniref:lysylphosphatidylglycerol synthetase family protein n=1 Tax=Ilumatobacter nonamiensis TaxID=467093 RepID=UPI00130DBF66|nr:lysylphosphatidylglycerol synthetase family protein [Ilumatobacter nonamiensis]
MESATTKRLRLREQDRRDWKRHPVDVARLMVRLLMLAAVLALTAAFPTALTNVSSDLVELFSRMPTPLRYALVGFAQLSLLVIPVIVVGWLLIRRTRRATALVVGASVVSGVVMVLLTNWLTRVAPPVEITDLASSSFVATDLPSVGYLAALVAGASVASPLMSSYWRRVSWLAVGVAVAVRVLSATQAPVSIAVTVTLGAAIGSAALVAFGSPQRRPGAASLSAALHAGGFEIDALGDEATERGLRTYHGRDDGRLVDVTYLDRDDRDAELFARVIRSIKVRDVEEQKLSVKPRVRAAQIALATSMAGRTGARVPEILAVAPADSESAVYVSAHPDGEPLTDADPDAVTDAALDDAWRQIGRLHAGRIAHRSLSGSNLVLDGDEVTLLGMDTALLASSDESRAIDRADLLVSMALVVGVDRSLDSAVRIVDARLLETTLPFVQVRALPARAQREVRHHKELIDQLRTGLQDRLGVDEVELAELERVSIAKVVTWVGFGVLAFFLLTLVSNWSEIREAMSGINWVWAIPVLLATLMGTVAGAMSLSGSVVRPIALGEAIIVMFGQSFLNRFTPMNAGGMAMRIRYLQKGGTDGTVAAAAIGLTSAVSGVVQVGFIAFFLLWSSTDVSSDTSSDGGGGSPDLTVVLVFVGAAIVAAIAIALTPKLRRWVVSFVKSTVQKIRTDFGELARRPTKMALLFGGATLGKLMTIVAFVASCRAFDIDLSFATLGALYMVATTIASTVPTPGGVGAVEAALVLVLTNAGVDDATAWAAVLLFRLINYWFPTIPGYVALKMSERRELV